MPVYSAVYDALVKYDKDKGVKAGLAEKWHVDALVKYDKDKGVKAGLAEKWHVDESGKVYEFHLKRTLNSQMAQL